MTALLANESFIEHAAAAGVELTPGLFVYSKTAAQPVFDEMKRQIRANVFESHKPTARVLSFREFAAVYTQKHIENPEKPLHPKVKGRVGMAVKEFGDMPITEIDTEVVEDYFAELALPALLNPNHQQKRTRTCATLNRHKALVGHMFTWGLERGYLGKGARHPFYNAFGLRLIKQRDEDNKRTRILSVDEEVRLLRLASRAMRRWIVFATDTGLRTGETLSLTVADFDARPGCVRVRGVNAKSGKTRFVPLATNRVRVVAAECRADLSGYAKASHALAFCDGTGGQACYSRGAWEALRERAGMSDFRRHDFRATCGTRLLNGTLSILADGAGTIAPMPAAQVRDWLGHSSVAVTEAHYDRTPFEQLLASAGRLGVNITNVTHTQGAGQHIERLTAA